MLNFSLDFKGNRQTIESREPVFYTLADLQSDEEAESIISCLCLEIDMTEKSEFCVILDGINLTFFWSPTLADFLIDLPSFINKVDGANVIDEIIAKCRFKRNPRSQDEAFPKQQSG